MPHEAAGIASQSMTAQPQQVEQAPGLEANAPVADEQVTPEEQQAFDKVSTAAMSAIFENEKSHKAIMKSLKGGADQPAKTIAQIVIGLFAKIDKDSGGKMPVSIMYGVVEDIADQVIELAEASGAMVLDEQTKGQIAQELVVNFGQVYDIPPEELQQLISEYPEEEVQGMVQQQEQIAMGGANAQFQ